MRDVSGQPVCVIGGAGFLGSHLVNYLVDKKGCMVTVVDNLCVGRREFVNENAELVHHDITGSEEFLFQLFRSQKIKYVLNYAAWPYIPDSFERPLQVFSVNATGAIKVINAAHAAGCEAILQVSSAELYGNGGTKMLPGGARLVEENTKATMDETFPVEPHSTYGAAKAAVDYYCQASWREREVPVIALRQFNCLGERETHPYVVPEIIGQLSNDKFVSLGNNSSRDFLYAGDAVRMAVALLENGQFGEVYNLGSQDSIKIYDLAHKIGKVMGYDYVTIHQDPERRRPWEIWHLQSDNTKIYEAIKERPEVGLDEALERTVTNYRANGSRWCWENA